MVGVTGAASCQHGVEVGDFCGECGEVAPCDTCSTLPLAHRPVIAAARPATGTVRIYADGASTEMSEAAARQLVDALTPALEAMELARAMSDRGPDA